MATAKRIVIIGLGTFGGECAERLAADGCEVLALDIGQKVVNEIAERVAQARRVDARDFEALAALITDRFDAAIVSPGMKLEDSILAVLNLLNLGVRNLHVKAVSSSHAEILQALAAKYGAELNLIFPERQAAERLAMNILHPNVLENIALTDDYVICEIATPDRFAGKTLLELQVRNTYGVYVIAVHEHLTEKTEFMPGPHFVCKPSDSLVVVGQEKDIKKIRDLLV
ncbi:potassium transporter Trk [Planctomycetales bacterium]|nr:potassium transporter Trk [Planctomycetales bacterium]GHS98933.1 potassium transporter Trk [Planctomycetales bacterium]GHV24011.1 potassium transporter Trk [Planctomycetales bacterium]